MIRTYRTDNWHVLSQTLSFFLAVTLREITLYFHNFVSHLTLQGSVRTFVRWSGLFLCHTVKHLSL